MPPARRVQQQTAGVPRKRYACAIHFAPDTGVLLGYALCPCSCRRRSDTGGRHKQPESELQVVCVAWADAQKLLVVGTAGGAAYLQGSRRVTNADCPDGPDKSSWERALAWACRLPLVQSTAEAVRER